MEMIKKSDLMAAVCGHCDLSGECEAGHCELTDVINGLPTEDIVHTQSTSEKNRLMGEMCEYCKHSRPCKVLVNKRWVWFKICTVLLDGSEHEHALVVTGNDMCEMYTPKGERK